MLGCAIIVQYTGSYKGPDLYVLLMVFKRRPAHPKVTCVYSPAGSNFQWNFAFPSSGGSNRISSGSAASDR